MNKQAIINVVGDFILSVDKLREDRKSKFLHLLSIFNEFIHGSFVKVAMIFRCGVAFGILGCSSYSIFITQFEGIGLNFAIAECTQINGLGFEIMRGTFLFLISFTILLLCASSAVCNRGEQNNTNKEMGENGYKLLYITFIFALFFINSYFLGFFAKGLHEAANTKNRIGEVIRTTITLLVLLIQVGFLAKILVGVHSVFSNTLVVLYKYFYEKSK